MCTCLSLYVTLPFNADSALRGSWKAPTVIGTAQQQQQQQQLLLLLLLPSPGHVKVMRQLAEEQVGVHATQWAENSNCNILLWTRLLRLLSGPTFRPDSALKLC
jgi:hypothetical protein